MVTKEEQRKKWRENKKNWRVNNPEKAKETRQKYEEGNISDVRKARRIRNRKDYQKNKHKYRIREKARNNIPIPENQKCQRCKINPAIERHHEDYDKPLDVEFLCKSCHVKADKEPSGTHGSHNPACTNSWLLICPHCDETIEVWGCPKCKGSDNQDPACTNCGKTKNEHLSGWGKTKIYCSYDKPLQKFNSQGYIKGFNGARPDAPSPACANCEGIGFILGGQLCPSCDNQDSCANCGHSKGCHLRGKCHYDGCDCQDYYTTDEAELAFSEQGRRNP